MWMTVAVNSASLCILNKKGKSLNSHFFSKSKKKKSSEGILSNVHATYSETNLLYSRIKYN